MTPSPPENYFQFEKLLVELVLAGVDFAVVGGVAVSRRLLAGERSARCSDIEQDSARRIVGRFNSRSLLNLKSAAVFYTLPS